MKRRKDRRAAGGKQGVEWRPSGPQGNSDDAITPTSRLGLLLVGPPGLKQRELILLGIVLATIGISLRAYAVARAAVEHFDEGVYASNLYFGPPEYAYPMQRFYAPPLLPGLIETGMIVGLPANVAAMLPSFLEGCATIAAVWWFGRTWFGVAAGLAAATLVALSGFQVVFSAAALTDGLLGLWVVLAVGAMGKALVGDGTWGVPSNQSDGTRSVPTTLGAGLFTGLAWWTKYNGWLPLAIGAAALPVLWVVLRPTWKQMQQWLVCFVVTAVVAGLVWSPYLLMLREHGGYGPIAENHAKYVVGLPGWLDAFSRQAVNFLVLDGGWSGIAVIAAAAVVWLAPSEVEGRDEARRVRRAVGLSLVGVWWVGLLVATPFYWPYPRLLVPWVLATCLGAGWLIGLLKRGRGWSAIAGAAAVLLVAAMLGGQGWYSSSRMAGAGDRRGVMAAARALQKGLDTLVPPPKTRASSPTRAVYVYGEPAMFFQLAAGSERVVEPAQGITPVSALLEGRAIPTFLVAGPHAERDAEFGRQLAEAGGQWKLIGTYDYQPSKLVWLDLHDPRRAAEARDENEHAFRLYRFQP